MVRRARLATQVPGLVLADGRAGTAGPPPPANGRPLPPRDGDAWPPTGPPSRLAAAGCGQASSSRLHVRLRCVAGAPLRSPPRIREDATGPQRAGLGSPLLVNGAAHQGSRPGSPLRLRWFQNWQILVRVGRDKK
jgi:hypothetical protein